MITAKDSLSTFCGVKTRTKTFLHVFFILQTGVFLPTLSPAGCFSQFPHNASNPLQTMREQQQVIIQQNNTSHMQRNGIEPPPTQEQMKAGYYDRLALAREIKTRELYAEINKLDNGTAPSSHPEKIAELEKTRKKLHLADVESSNYKARHHHYEIAYQELVSMLSGKSPLNLKRAVFAVENAYYQNKLSYERYSRQINQLVSICKQVMQEKKLNPKNHIACHYAIQKLFSDKFQYKNTAGKVVDFEPLGYDFTDIFGDEDRTKGFVTKLLDTKTGQCHSLPLLYLIIAEGLNANAYLALAPNHSYVKFGNHHQSFNFETTNGTFTSDEWIVASGYISSTAIKNQIYLAPLSKDKVIAECLIDLAGGLEFLFGKSSFSTQCAHTALDYFPKSIRALLVINNLMVAECAQTAAKYNFPKESDYHKYPDLKKKFDELITMELLLEQAGYSKIPKEQYEEWQQTASEEKQKREHQKLFEKLQKTSHEN